MHKINTAQNIIELLEERAIKSPVQQGKQVWLEIGVMACVEVPLHFGWMSPLVIPLPYLLCGRTRCYACGARLVSVL